MRSKEKPMTRRLALEFLDRLADQITEVVDDPGTDEELKAEALAEAEAIRYAIAAIKKRHRAKK